jgi:hypothetical protein
LRDEALEDSTNLPNLDMLMAEILEDLHSALEQFVGMAPDIGHDESYLGLDLKGNRHTFLCADCPAIVGFLPDLP